MFDTVERAVVSVRTSSDPGGKGGVRRWSPSGYGFIVDSSGYILTSHQTVRGTSAVEVVLADGRTLPVTLIGRDPLNDVATLKVDATGLPTVALGESTALKVGQVVAVGRPAGPGHSVAVTTITATGGATGGRLATSMPLGPAGSGRPLLNTRGEAVGIATASLGASAPGFAVPIDRAKPLLRHLMTNQRATATGVTGSFLSPTDSSLRR